MKLARELSAEHLLWMLGMFPGALTGEQSGRPRANGKVPSAERLGTSISAETAGLTGDERDAVLFETNGEECTVETKIVRALPDSPHFLRTEGGNLAWALDTGRTQTVIIEAHQQPGLDGGAVTVFYRCCCCPGHRIRPQRTLLVMGSEGL